MNIAAIPAAETTARNAPVSFRRVLVALDQSDHASQALSQAVRLAASCAGQVTGIHVYAAQLHDRRFRQMEGGLPEQYRQESEMEHQREVHEDLIGMGLGLISDSYHDAADQVCRAAGVGFSRLSPEGKNYRHLAEAANSGNFDVLAMGAQGLGAVPGSSIGSVCERVARRAEIDVFVARDRRHAIGDGPLVVGMDGSPRSFGALMTGLEIARILRGDLHIVAAYDPYYHYVAFNKIATVLDEEKGKVFRFKEQERLHEELIDDGIAKIYDAHLKVARNLAQEHEVTVHTELLAGKPWQAVRRYLEKVGASLLLVGKTGVHADEMLDIGSNAENLLRSAPCHVWLSCAESVPPADLVAAETIQWSDEAETAISRAPDFVQGMARTAVIREAQKQHHTYITSRFVNEVMKKLMPGAGSDRYDGGQETVHKGFPPLEWKAAATAILTQVADEGLRENIRLRAEKSARRDAAEMIGPEHVTPFVEANQGEVTQPQPRDRGDDEVIWSSASLARLMRVPEAFREQVKEGVEDHARSVGASVIEGAIEDAGFAALRRAMCPVEPEDD